MPNSAPDSRAGFEIAIICALNVEANAIHDVFDTFWDEEDRHYGQAPGDDNSYTTGVIGQHNVVLVHMPGMGTVSSSSVAANLRSSFPHIKLGLIVGICGAVPTSSHHEDDIYLGDLIISTAIIQYDFGRQYDKVFERKDTIEDSPGRPNQRTRGLLAKLKTRRYRQRMQTEIAACLERIHDEDPEVCFPGVAQDCLYLPSYMHKHRDVRSCAICANDDQAVCQEALKADCRQLGCDGSRYLVYYRSQRGVDPQHHRPAIHFGRIGSGNTVMKSAERRDRIAEQDGIIAFEMEGAGVWDQFPTIVIKAACDYADAHKNKEWQRYAAAVAAAGMKALLKNWVPQEPGATQASTSSGSGHDESNPRLIKHDVRFLNAPNHGSQTGVNYGSLQNTFHTGAGR